MASKVPLGDTEGVEHVPINILIAGTPGVGKSTHASELATRLDMKYININDIAEMGNIYEGWDSELESKILDEDLIQEEIESMTRKGGCVVDYHSCDLFPKSWFKAVFVLRTDNTVLYDRLAKRGYNQVKLKNNIECEIFQEMLEEAREHFGLEMVMELYSNYPDDIDRNIEVMIGVVKGLINNSVSSI